MFPKHVFKAYDIRGLVEGELSADLAYKIGRAFGVFLKNKGVESGKKVVVGQDMRPSSTGFAGEVVRALNDEGFDVVDIGLVSTPLFNFACANYSEYLGGIMVTASHNPAEYNGFKMTMSNGLPIGKNTGMDQICALAEKNEFEDSAVRGGVESRDILPDYLDKILTLVKPNDIKPLKIVIDAGNGMGKVTFVEMLKRLPQVEVEYLYLEPDGTFPNHEANPLKVETLETLQKKVLENKADFGFALDGDADRIGLVDEKGAVVPASFVGALIGLEVLANSTEPQPLMYCDLRSSKVVREVWEEKGAKTALCPVGHALIKKIMKDKGGLFASELSLHLFFREMYDVESSDLALLYILKILSSGDKKLSELIKPFDKYFHSGELNFHTTQKERIFSELKSRFADAEIQDFDGLHFTLPTWWFSVRTSNTEPVLRLNLEANTKEEMEERLAEVQKIIEG